jgi:hypothetical protein
MCVMGRGQAEWSDGACCRSWCVCGTTGECVCVMCGEGGEVRGVLCWYMRCCVVVCVYGHVRCGRCSDAMRCTDRICV